MNWWVREKLLLLACVAGGAALLSWFSVRHARKPWVRNDWAASIAHNLLCYFVTGIVFMALEPLQRVSVRHAVSFIVRNWFTGFVLYALVYFVLYGVLFVIWWLVPLQVFAMRRYRRYRYRGIIG